MKSLKTVEFDDGECDSAGPLSEGGSRALSASRIQRDPKQELAL